MLEESGWVLLFLQYWVTDATYGNFAGYWSQFRRVLPERRQQIRLPDCGTSEIFDAEVQRVDCEFALSSGHFADRRIFQVHIAGRKQRCSPMPDGPSLPASFQDSHPLSKAEIFGRYCIRSLRNDFESGPVFYGGPLLIRYCLLRS